LDNILDLGKISEAIIEAWPEKFDQKDDVYYCKKCGTKIMAAPCYISLHLTAFDPICAGPGTVFNTVYPYCPKCEGHIDYARGCFHMDIDLNTLFQKYLEN
jgi:hypothetical protein